MIFYSGKDGFFDMTHVGTGERMNVQESWAKYHPVIEEGRDCVIAYLGKLNILRENIPQFWNNSLEYYPIVLLSNITTQI